MEDFGDVLAAAKRGEAWAFTALWRRFAPAVTGYLRGRGAQEPDDLTSEVFLAVFHRIGRFRGDEPALRTFVFTVAHHRLVDDLRRRSRAPVMAEWDDDSDRRTTESAEHEALTSIASQDVQAVLETLSPEQRDVMLLRVVADLPLEQVADVLGKPVGAVKSLQHRALTALRKRAEEAVSR